MNCIEWIRGTCIIQLLYARLKIHACALRVNFMCTGCFKVADNTDTCSCYFLPQSCLSLSCRRELIMISDCCIHRQQTKNDTFQNYMNYTAGYSLMYIYMYIHVCSVYECVCVHWERRENNDIVYCNENEESCQMCVFSGCIFCSFSTEH